MPKSNVWECRPTRGSISAKQNQQPKSGYDCNYNECVSLRSDEEEYPNNLLLCFVFPNTLQARVPRSAWNPGKG